MQIQGKLFSDAMCQLESPTSILMDIPSSHSDSICLKSLAHCRNDEFTAVFGTSSGCHRNQER